MTCGVITTRHILLHPLTLISCFGFATYLHMIVMSLSFTHHCFLDYLKF